MRPHHSERLAEEIRLELSRLIEGELRDPRIGSATVTAVRVAPDLRTARVFVTAMGSDAEVQATMRGLVAAANFLRHELAESLDLRHTPELAFEIDTSLQHGERVEELLKRIKQQ